MVLTENTNAYLPCTEAGGETEGEGGKTPLLSFFLKNFINL